MCGIAGFFSPKGINEEKAIIIAGEMSEKLIHRGPDDGGIWVDSSVGIAMAHKRLSIIDLSPAGHQPMHSDSGRYVLIFNGEIYNHNDIRKEIEKCGNKKWRGYSDTETLLAAIELWGLEKTLKLSVGMFALVLWDRYNRKLMMARDRMGEKPLYYGWQKETLLFGSELKSIKIHPDFNGEIDRDVLPLFFRYGYIPSPWSIWKGILKLQPGTIICLSDYNKGELPEPVSFWSLNAVIEDHQKNIIDCSNQEAIDMLDMQLRSTIKGQMMADVPIGAFLSGGIDSSTIVALMQMQTSKPIKTFTIGFYENKYNEAQYAKKVASYLGTDHTELYLSDLQVTEVIPQLQEIYDEPFGDSSAIPTYLVSKLTKNYVTVSLSGDGGDELFGGYERYYNKKAVSLWLIMKNMPKIFIKILNLIEKNTKIINDIVYAKYEDRMRTAIDISLCKKYIDFYKIMIKQWKIDPIKKNSNIEQYEIKRNLVDKIDPIHLMMLYDSQTYLPDDILVKIDRAGMAVSLETRVPFLDHRIIELAWSMPIDMKVNNGVGKWILKEILHKYLPKEIIDRPKMGFGIPVSYWLKGSLREWAEDMLSEKLLKEYFEYDIKVIRKRWEQHITGQANWNDSIWLILMLQEWFEKNK
jgi:asparagine synthase (glutamine-hydrolysing)